LLGYPLAGEAAGREGRATPTAVFKGIREPRNTQPSELRFLGPV
jgi:hypothetical protein